MSDFNQNSRKMKKTKQTVRYSKTPPTGYPTEAEWKAIERKLGKSLGSQMLAPDASPVDKTKHDICAQFVIYKRDTEVTQRELAKRLEVTESRVSEILHYHYDRFTIDKLLELLSKIRPEVRLKVA